MTKRNRDNDATVKMTIVQPTYVFKAIKSYGDPYEEVIHPAKLTDMNDIHKIMAEGISQYCSDTENLRLPRHETWQLLENGKIVECFTNADLEDKERFWVFVQMIRNHGCMIFEIRNDY